MEVPMYRWQGVGPAPHDGSQARQQQLAALTGGSAPPILFRLLPTGRRYWLAPLTSWDGVAAKLRDNRRKPFAVNEESTTLHTEAPELWREVTIWTSIPAARIWRQPVRARLESVNGVRFWAGALPGAWGPYQQNDPDLDGWTADGWIVEGWTS